MPTDVEGQEKKPASKRESYDELVTVKHWDGKKFFTPIENVPMFRVTDKEGVTRMWTWPGMVAHANPSKGSELTVGAETYIVDKVEKGTSAYVSTVKKKP